MILTLAAPTWDGMIALGAAICTAVPCVIGILIKIDRLAQGQKAAEVKMDERHKENAARLEKLDGYEVLKDQHKQMWDERQDAWRMMRIQGDVGASMRGVGTRQSPLALTGDQSEAHAREIYGPLLDELHAFYVALPQDTRENEDTLYRETARRFIEKLADEVCPQLGVTASSAVSIAVALMKENAPSPDTTKTIHAALHIHQLA